MAQNVTASDNPADYPSPYRYIMNGSELSIFGIGSIGLVPLSASLWSLSPEDFSNTMVGGNLQNVNASTASGLTTYTIPYISCDDPNVMKTIGDSFNSTDIRNVLAAVLYSQHHTHCNISSALAVAGWLNLLTVSDMHQAQQVAALGLNGDSMGIVQIFPDLGSLPPGTHLQAARKGSPIPMIILYALTSIITVLLLTVIIGGAIKARRHPERYGPRASMGRPRQSRAKGIAMAMLETLPIVRFGDPDPKHAKAVGAEGDVEMTPAKTGATAEDKEPTVEQPSKETEQDTPKHVTDTSNHTARQTTTEEATASSATKNNPDPTPAAAAAAAGEAVEAKPNVPAVAAQDFPSCSICTEDFTLGEELRVLPCNHKFHPLCVDPWLLNISGTCPLCRIDLRPPQEATDNDNNEDAVIVPAFQLHVIGGLPSQVQRRSTSGGIMRVTRGLDLQSIMEASREERIRILRRWREERRLPQPQPQPQPEDGTDGIATANVNANPNTSAQRRGRPLSQWLREGLTGRSSPGPRPPQPQHVASGSTDRPRTWFAGESVPEHQAPQLPPLPSNDAVTPDERARTWYGGEVGAGAGAGAQERPPDTRSLGEEQAPRER